MLEILAGGSCFIVSVAVDPLNFMRRSSNAIRIKPVANACPQPVFLSDASR